MEVDEPFDVGERIRRLAELELTSRFGPADLPANLVARLLVEGREERFEFGPLGKVRDRADVLTLEIERPALAHLATAECRREDVGSRVAATEPAKIDDVPRRGMARIRGRGVVGEVIRDRVRDRRQIGRGGEDRRVVGVV